MELQDSMAEANRILREAGWRPVPVWKGAGERVANTEGAFAYRNLVGGITPDGLACHMKDWTQVRPGDPDYGPDTPDEPHEAAAWLAELYTPPVALEPLAIEPEAEESAAHESDSEIAGASVAEAVGEPVPDGVQREEPSAETEAQDAGLDVPSEAPIDADFSEVAEEESLDLGVELLEDAETLAVGELPAPEPEDFAPDEAKHEGPGAFIFGDNLDQMRTAAIGLVIRHARTLMPFWTTNHLAALIELRNFAMGVAENRWPDDPGRRLELESYETTLRRISEIERARDAKVEFLEGASRAEVESFDVEADWP